MWLSIFFWSTTIHIRKRLSFRDNTPLFWSEMCIEFETYLPVSIWVFLIIVHDTLFRKPTKNAFFTLKNKLRMQNVRNKSLFYMPKPIYLLCNISQFSQVRSSIFIFFTVSTLSPDCKVFLFYSFDHWAPWEPLFLAKVSNPASWEHISASRWNIGHIYFTHIIFWIMMLINDMRDQICPFFASKISRSLFQ